MLCHYLFKLNPFPYVLRVLFLVSLIPDNKIKEIQHAADIIDIISETVLLKKAGKNFVGLCPFHTEKTPSFTVSPAKQIFHCFGCGCGGDIFRFIMKQNGLNFPEAVTTLARRYGIEIESQQISPAQQRRITEKEQLLDINNIAMLFFQSVLKKAQSSRKAQNYLTKRGMSETLIDKFKLGYAPSGWDNLLKHLNQKQISLSMAEKAGLIVQRKTKNGFYDRFRERIIFPILNPGNKIIGFGGRVMDDSLPKYLNSPESPVYNKSKSLYGLHIAKSFMRETQTAYLVEGYFDVLALHLHKVNNSVATLGTSMTDAHVQLLKGCLGSEGKVILVYDSDKAGIKAALRSIPIFNQGFLEVRILVLPPGYDPDSYIMEFGKDLFLKIAADALGVIPFLIETAVKKHGVSVEGKIHILNDLIKPLAGLSDNIVKTLYIKQLAERLGINESAVLEKVKTSSIQQGNRSLGQSRAQFKRLPNIIESQPKNSDPAPTKYAVNKGINNRIEVQLLKMLLQFPEMAEEIRKNKIIDLFEDQSLKAVGKIILKHDDTAKKRITDILIQVNEESQSNLIASLLLKEEVWDYKGCQRLIEQFKIRHNRHQTDLLQKIKDAEANNDIGLVTKILQRKQNKARQSDVLRRQN